MPITNDLADGESLGTTAFFQLFAGDADVLSDAAPAADATKTVGSVNVTAGGSGYTSAPTVAFAAPPAGGVQATGHAVLTNGAVSSVVIDNPGYGYTSAPAVTFSGGGGTGAAATAVLGTGTLVFAKFEVASMAADGSLVKFTPGDGLQHVILSQPNAGGAGSSVPYYYAGSFNWQALVWPASITTEAAAKAVFMGTPLHVTHVLT